VTPIAATYAAVVTAVAAHAAAAAGQPVLTADAGRSSWLFGGLRGATAMPVPASAEAAAAAPPATAAGQPRRCSKRCGAASEADAAEAFEAALAAADVPATERELAARWRAHLPGSVAAGGSDASDDLFADRVCGVLEAQSFWCTHRFGNIIKSRELMTHTVFALPASQGVSRKLWSMPQSRIVLERGRCHCSSQRITPSALTAASSLGGAACGAGGDAAARKAGRCAPGHAVFRHPADAAVGRGRGRRRRRRRPRVRQHRQPAGLPAQDGSTPARTAAQPGCEHGRTELSGQQTRAKQLCPSHSGCVNICAHACDWPQRRYAPPAFSAAVYKFYMQQECSAISSLSARRAAVQRPAAAAAAGPVAAECRPPRERIAWRCATAHARRQVPFVFFPPAAPSTRD